MSQKTILVLLREGIDAARAGDKAKTRRLLREVTELDPVNELAWLWLAGVAASASDALACLERVLTLNPANERAQRGIKTAYLQAGIALAQAGQRDEARERLTEAARHDPGNELAWLWLAGVTDDPDRALDYLRRALKINPSNPRALKGVAFYEAKRRGPVVPAPTWKCPLCATEAAEEPKRCPRCRAFLALDPLEPFLAEEPAPAEPLRRLAERFLAFPADKRDFAVNHALGLALLNLRRFDEAQVALLAAARQQPSAAVFRQQVASLQERRLQAEAALRARAEAEEVRRAAAGLRTVLVVDDSPTIRKVVTMTLEREGHRTITAANGEEALDALRQHGVPDLVFLDITMPRMDGYELCKLLRTERETAKVPVVMLSGKDGLFNKLRGQWAGATDYLTKPFTPEVLVKAVERYSRPRAQAVAG